MFKETFFEPEAYVVRKILAVPIALAIHAALIAALIVAPLIKSGGLPAVPDVIDVFFAPPPAPLPPPAKKGFRKAGQARIKPVLARPLAAAGRLIAPVDIPRGIVDEALPDLAGDGADVGVDWGIEGGSEDGAFRGVVGPVIEKIAGDGEAQAPALAVVKAPRLLEQVPPVYPEIARLARVAGTVIIEAETDVGGRVVRWKIVRSIPLLDRAAIDAVKQWVYEPMVVNGEPRGVIFNVTVRFELK
jgi:protein TonB